MSFPQAVKALAPDVGRVIAPEDLANQVTSACIEGAIAYGCIAPEGQARTELREAYGDRQRIMSAFRIYYDGRYYRYNGYRYDRLGDAVAYAELMQSRQSTEVGPNPFTPGDTLPLPSASDRELMAAWFISFTAGVYAYREFRYDQLADAVNYARLDFGRRGSSHKPGRDTSSERERQV